MFILLLIKLFSLPHLNGMMEDEAAWSSHLQEEREAISIQSGQQSFSRLADKFDVLPR